MRVKCRYNNLSLLDKKLHGYAFNQDENGDIDITIGKIYDVYGIQENILGKFYLVLTDELNNELPWWMPSDLYVIEDVSQPEEWVERRKSMSNGGELKIRSYPIYFEVEEDIEDGTERGHAAFERMKKANM